MNGGELFKKENVNLNTLLGVVSFLVVFTSIVVSFTLVQFKVGQMTSWQLEHEQAHEKLAADRIARNTATGVRIDELNKDINKLQQAEYRLAQAEKAVETINDRISRVTESYGNQFTEIRGQLNQIAIQLALSNDALKRIETTKEDKAP